MHSAGSLLTVHRIRTVHRFVGKYGRYGRFVGRIAGRIVGRIVGRFRRFGRFFGRVVIYTPLLVAVLPKNAVMARRRLAVRVAAANHATFLLEKFSRLAGLFHGES